MRSIPASVLIVEDDPAVRGLLGRQLDRLGFRASSASCLEGASEALADSAGSGFDLVVTDLDLGRGGEGMEVVTLAKRGSSEVRVLLVTGCGSRQIEAEALQKGADGYLEKPWSLRELKEALSRLGFGSDEG